jgi:hypothetical protein
MVDENMEMFQEINDDIEDDDNAVLEEPPTPCKLTSKPMTNPIITQPIGKR